MQNRAIFEEPRNDDSSIAVYKDLINEENENNDEIIILLKAKIDEVNRILRNCDEVLNIVQQNQLIIKETKRNYQTSLNAYKRARSTH